MAKAKQLPSGAWRVQVYSHSEIVVQPDGSTKKMPKYESFTADTADEANFLAAQYRLDRKAQSKGNKKLSIDEAVTRYIDAKTNIISPTTLAGYIKDKNNYFGAIGSLDIYKVTNEDLQIWINGISAGHSPKTVRNVFGLLTATMAVYRPDFAIRVDLPKKQKQWVTIPTEAEFSRLLQDVVGTDMEIPVLLAGCAGLRRSEISALSDIDPAANTIHIKQAMVLDKDRKWVIKAPKSYAGDRILEVPGIVMDRMVARVKDGKPIVDLTPDQITDKFRFIKKRLGLGFTFHGLRHYYASVMLALNIPNKYAAERMGHATDYMLQQVYQRTMNAKSIQFGVQVNKHFASTISHDLSHGSNNT